MNTTKAILLIVLELSLLGYSIYLTMQEKQHLDHWEIVIEKDDSNHIKSISWYHNGILDSTKHIKSY